MARNALIIAMLLGASPAFAQSQPFPDFLTTQGEPRLELGERNFSLPVIDYRAPDGSVKRASGIIIGKDISPNATVGLGFFKMKPKYSDPTATNAPTGGKSKKVSLGMSLKF